MEVEVHCDDQICCSEELIRSVEGVITGTLERFHGRIARVQAHLRDLNGAGRALRDRICSVEAVIADTEARVLASHEAITLSEAIHGAAGKLERLLAQELQQLDQTFGSPVKG